LPGRRPGPGVAFRPGPGDLRHGAGLRRVGVPRLGAGRLGRLPPTAVRRCRAPLLGPAPDRRPGPRCHPAVDAGRAPSPAGGVAYPARPLSATPTEIPARGLVFDALAAGPDDGELVLL